MAVILIVEDEVFIRHNAEWMIEDLGHDVLRRERRGSGGGFGLPAITDFGAGIEQSAAAADDGGTRKWLGALSTYLNPA